ncbi:hypothetical protein E4U41_006947 [Claviceps citrina]|nr:hypothetical protein E4U41_006947 [Claviceps citrina]
MGRRRDSAKVRRQPQGKSKQETREEGPKGWRKAPVMPTAKAQAYQDHQRTIIEAEEEYLGPPPQNENLFEATLVVPGKHMFLPELFDATRFDAIRKAHLVWIVQEKPNIVRIHSRTLSNLKEGFREVNWAIHNMRTAQHNVSSLFLVQLPIEGECPITVDLDCRPTASPGTRSPQLIPVQEISHIADGLMKELRESFLSSTDILQGSPEQMLQMRIDFGLVKIRRRKRIAQGNGNGNEMPYADFADMTSQYGKRGGADFEEKLEGARLAANTIRHLLQPTTGFFHDHQNPTFHDTISIKLQDNNTLEADIKRATHGPAVLTNVRLMTQDHWPPLKWTVLAPDRKYDWCFRLDSGKNLPISAQISQLINSIVVNSDTHDISTGQAFLQNPVNIEIKDPQLWTRKVDRILLRSTVAIPFRDTPYVMDVSLNRVWQGVDTQAYPHQSWQSLGFHGVHWAAELNSVNATDTRRVWGAHQRDVWRGSAKTAEGQFKEFICYVLEAMSALDGVQS